MKQATTDKLNSPTTRKKNVQLRKTPPQSIFAWITSD
jgi:hypothetical protein